MTMTCRPMSVIFRKDLRRGNNPAIQLDMLKRVDPDKCPPEAVREAMAYDPLTGVFRWIAPFGKLNHRYIGKEAGCVCEGGYIRIGVAGRSYEAGRLAWWFVHGEMPPSNALVDHKDRNPGNNAIANLRLASPSLNGGNCKDRPRTASRFRGVVLHGKKWRASIRHDGEIKRLGRFDNDEDAARAYDAAARELFGPNAALNFGD